MPSLIVTQLQCPKKQYLQRSSQNVFPSGAIHAAVVSERSLLLVALRIAVTSSVIRNEDWRGMKILALFPVAGHNPFAILASDLRPCEGLEGLPLHGLSKPKTAPLENKPQRVQVTISPIIVGRWPAPGTHGSLSSLSSLPSGNKTYSGLCPLQQKRLYGSVQA